MLRGVDFRPIRHGTIDSTSERAFAALAAGTARHGDVHLARAQSAGRGRFGRRWESAAGEGLYASVVLAPRGAPPPPALTIAGGLAVLDCVRALGLAGARLVWPNDVVVDGAKLAGVLVETRGLDPAAPHYVLGIGLNVAQRCFPPALLRERPVTSLALEGSTATVAQAERALLAALGPRVDAVDHDWDALARDFLAATGLAGRAVRVETGAESREGVVAALDLARGIAVERDAGERGWIALEHVRRVSLL
jgi:BirA family biotin operon repressor/biotin-[acetyl-CoA-carboxylase] ligase